MKTLDLPLSPVAMLPLVVAALAIAVLLAARRRLKRSRDDGCGGYLEHIFDPSCNIPPCRIRPHLLLGHLPNVFSPPDDERYSSGTLARTGAFSGDKHSDNTDRPSTETSAVFVDNSNAFGISSFWFLRSRSVCVLKKEHARAVLRHSIERQGNWLLQRHFRRSLGGSSIVLMSCNENDRDTWRVHRNLMRSSFTSKAVKKQADKVFRVSSNMVRAILKECDHSHAGGYSSEAADLFKVGPFRQIVCVAIGPTNLDDPPSKLATLDIFGVVALDYNFGCTDTLSECQITKALNLTIEDSNKRCAPCNIFNPFVQLYFLPTQRNREHRRHSQKVHNLIRKLCQQRWREIREDVNVASECAYTDLLSSLIRSKMELHDGSFSSEAVAHDDLVEMLLTLFFAGYDTSSVALSYVMWFVATSPRIQEECALEALGSDVDKNAADWECSLVYCRAVLMEALRLHPPVYSNNRHLNKELVLDGCIIPKDTRVYLPIGEIHTYSQNFPRAKEFLPERWARKDSVTGRWVDRDPNEQAPDDPTPSFVPPANRSDMFTFSDGARNCLGQRLAIQECTIVLAALMRDLVVSVPEGLELTKRKKFALAPPVQMPLTFRRRER